MKQFFILLFLAAAITLVVVFLVRNSPHDGATVWEGSAPEACIQIYAPVRGKDGTVYGNACSAAMEGALITWPVSE